ncbi:cytochrome P450 [Psychromarinibacter sp. C21-152]|uniref:Cytochrome P450 n=1 Tax=Psychromarinibacter sediminicola TaxID=3033385 RepID=A0AAE3NQ47_9RHOB|nr:cytochrome P450 [Psychromarinibacter sediminicola]MDF0601468.1 cytochrome P450 [Psychromarinibacter sediminicola]
MPRLSQSPTAPAFVQDPYPFYDRMRAMGPLVWWEDYAMPCAAGAAEVNALLRDRRLGREVPAETAPDIPDRLRPFYDIEAHSMLELEPPRHTRLRSLVLRAFTSRRIAGMAPEIETLCHRLVDALPAGEVDLLPAYCTQVPVIVIARLLGVPDSMAPELLSWSNAMVAMYQARRDRAVEDAACAAAAEFSDFMRGYVAERRSRPADDLITHLIAAEEDGERLTTDELITTCILLLNAGHEATVHAMGNGVKALLDHGTPPDRLASDTVEATVEEILRYDPPLQMFTRYAYDDLDLFGHRLTRGDQVALLLGAANRDPAVWPDPARFDPARPVKSNVAFGAGLHFCVGAPLARLELQVALRVLFDRLPGLRLAAPPRYADLYHFHGLSALPVVPG